MPSMTPQYCRHCGTALTAQQKFCTGCGEAIFFGTFESAEPPPQTPAAPIIKAPTESLADLSDEPGGYAPNPRRKSVAFLLLAVSALGGWLIYSLYFSKLAVTEGGAQSSPSSAQYTAPAADSKPNGMIRNIDSKGGDVPQAKVSTAPKFTLFRSRLSGDWTGCKILPDYYSEEVFGEKEGDSDAWKFAVNGERVLLQLMPNNSGWSGQKGDIKILFSQGEPEFNLSSCDNSCVGFPIILSVETATGKDTVSAKQMCRNLPL